MHSFPEPLQNSIDVPPRPTPLAWPTWAAEYIVNQYKTKGDRELANDLTTNPNDTRTYTAKMVEKKRLGLHLRRDNVDRIAILQRNKAAGCFKRAPDFKAKHTVEEGGIRTWKEKLSDGGERLTLRIKVGGEMVSLSVHTWEKAYGPVPEGYIVSFVDNNPLNCELINLRLLTRAENIARNRNLEKNQQRHKESLKTRAQHQRQQYLDLKSQLEAVQKRKLDIKQGDVDERFTMNMIEQITQELTRTENDLLRSIYMLPESAKMP